jgi:hypothetical protein
MRTARIEWVVAVALAVFASAARTDGRQAPVKEHQAETVLFICPHGAAKSVLASAYFQRLALTRSQRIQCEARAVDECDDRKLPSFSTSRRSSESRKSPSSPVRKCLEPAWRVIANQQLRKACEDEFDRADTAAEIARHHPVRRSTHQQARGAMLRSAARAVESGLARADHHDPFPFERRRIADRG